MKQPIKNPTPQHIALYAALYISFILSIFLLILYITQIINFGWAIFGLIAFLAFLTSYLVIRFFLKKYIYRKIKLIYKSIRSTKVATKENPKDINLNTNIIDDVEKDVAIWAKKQNQEIESLKAMETYRRNFLGDISHELKTPIFNIQGYIHTLLEGALYDEKINKNFLTRAANNVERLHTIVQDLEEIARLESGAMILDVQEFGVKELVVEVFEDLEMMAKEMNITLQYKEGADQNYKVKADREKVRRVLMNLVVNSIKYGNEHGYTKLGFYDMDSFVLVEIADNGLGIENQDLKRVFERFFRADKSRSRKQGGSGLGLSIVKHIIEAHKQTINLRSTIGVGSTFGFTLEKAK